ncbi:MAG: cobyrinate a,c-diamide synthase, partial [Deltaproteobacteria bacterium]|nr:cobyrinate a,c-diamide synthase [Deltaproteobacteria bacterium]
MQAFIIAGTHSGAGKTTIALGLMSALRKRGMNVQPFKVGPDYIDPSYHRAVCGRPSYNLDTWMMGAEGVKKTFAKTMQGADIGIIEGVMGLFDGKDGRDEKGSTAHVAKVLGIPVILVVDAGSMARSAGALVYGYEKFDPKVKIAGVIFNRVGTEKHFKMLKEAVEAKGRARVLGYIPRDAEISLPERHLGLVMAEEKVASCKLQVARLKKIGELIEKFVDIDGILKAVASCKLQVISVTSHIPHPTSHIPKIAVALDNAFCFYYQENLDMLKQLGAELVFFSPLKARKLPADINGIYFGGGYPELYAKKLEANKPMRKAIKDFADKGFPIYAECGGLMYLGKGLKDFKGKKHEMVGVFPWVSRMLEKRKSLGYREIKAAEDCLFLKKGQTMRGHEYHYSEIDKPSQKIKRGYRLTPHTSRLTASEGYLCKNTLASYVHLHFASNPKFAEGFVKKCRRKELV